MKGDVRTMNLETKLDSRVWAAIESTYEGRNYTNAILDATYFLSGLIREKTGLESDGVALVGQAFGGKAPKLKVGKLQSESDWNVQKGLEQILRGFYLAIRNPRSHEKYADSKEDADSLILFINHLVKIIDQSKPPFTKSAFINRVFDADFVENQRYAQLLVNEIPPKQKLEVLIDVYRKKETGDGEKLRYFFNEVYSQLTEEEKAQVHEMVSEELKQTDDETTIRLVLQILPAKCWPAYSEVARLRVENKLIQAIRTGRYDPEAKRCTSGALGTWASGRLEYFALKKDLLGVLLDKLESTNRREQDYVFKFFFYHFPDIFEVPTPWMVQIVNKGLESGDVRFNDAMSYYMQMGPDSWKRPFQKAYNEFQEVEPTPEPDDDDLPF